MSNTFKLNGLFATKLGMSSVYGETGEVIPVTLLKYTPWIVTQIKTTEKDGYVAVQISNGPKRAKRTSGAQKGHLKSAGFESGAYLTREVRVEKLPEGVVVGSALAIDSLTKGDFVNATSRTKGRGFQGSVKRFGFGGGPGAHGSKFHRQPGSSGNRTWPGRVMPGKRFPGHYGDEQVTVKNLKVVDIDTNENVLVVKGAIPGAPNTLVKLSKQA